MWIKEIGSGATKGSWTPKQCHITPFLKNDAIKMGTNWIGSMESTDDGLLILAHNEGYLMVWPDKFDGFEVKSELSFSKVVVDDESFLDHPLPLHIPAETNRFNR